MSIVNVKVANIRPQHENLKEWMADPKNVYVGRAGIVFIDGKRFPPQSSVWCNNFKISKTQDRNSVIEQYEAYIREALDNEADTRHTWEELRKLKGKNLGCWCAPEACHGDILLKLLDEI